VHNVTILQLQITTATISTNGIGRWPSALWTAMRDVRRSSYICAIARQMKGRRRAHIKPQTVVWITCKNGHTTERASANCKRRTTTELQNMLGVRAYSVVLITVECSRSFSKHSCTRTTANVRYRFPLGELWFGKVRVYWNLLPNVRGRSWTRMLTERTTGLWWNHMINVDILYTTRRMYSSMLRSVDGNMV